MQQYLTLDFAIVACYLLLTLVVGLATGRNIKTMKDYVIGDRKSYTTSVLVMTLFSTVIGGGVVLGIPEKVFSSGLIYPLSALGFFFSLYFLAPRYIAPHMNRFREKLSVGEMMRGFYGVSGQVVTGAAGTILCVAIVGSQVKAIGYLFSYFLNMQHSSGVLIACGIVVIYSSLGGIRSVTATDVTQFGILIIVVPLVACQAVWHVGDFETVYTQLPKGHFEILSRSDLWTHVSTFFLWAIGIAYLDPAGMQRLLMARDVQQTHNFLRAAGLLFVALLACVSLTAFAILASGSNLNPQSVMPYAIDTLLETGLKGFGIAGLFAVIMSSADSYLHAAAVSLVHDVVQPLRRDPLPDSKELRLAKVATLLLGFGSLWAAMSFEGVLEVTFKLMDLWIPTVLVPLVSGIVGYYSSIRSFGIAAISGIVAVLLWKLGLGSFLVIDATIPALLVNLIAFTIARRFDTSKNIYYDPDDMMAPLAKAKKEEEEKLRAQGKLPAFLVCANGVFNKCKPFGEALWAAFQHPIHKVQDYRGIFRRFGLRCF